MSKNMAKMPPIWCQKFIDLATTLVLCYGRKKFTRIYMMVLINVLIIPQLKCPDVDEVPIGGRTKGSWTAQEEG